MTDSRRPAAASRPSLPRSRPFRLVAAALVLALVAFAAYRWLPREGAAEAGAYRTAPVERGDIRVAISATGTLAATSTVDIGSQISGQVTDVLVDFNDRVTRGQVLARLDPSTYEAQIAQGSAQVAGARANLAAAEAALRNAQADYARKAELGERQLVSRGDVDLARAALDQARAQANAARAQIGQQQAATRTSRVNLERSVIRSPVDGVVLTRSIEPGQTVAASLQAPVMFQIAEDLARMEIVLAIDEADIGQVRVGQGVAFTVDAFPDRRFRGRVQQVRLSPTNTNNVITYPVVVEVDNTDLALLPGMTANAEIEVSRRDGVLRVPNAALRFKPQEEPAAGAAPRADRGGMADELPRIAGQLELDARQQAAFDEAVAAMRERMNARRATPPQGNGGGGSVLFGRGPGGPQGGRVGGGAGGPSAEMRQRMQERFSRQFEGFRATLSPAQQQQWDRELGALLAARRAPLYRLVDGRPEAVVVRVGASDGSFTEIAGSVREGDVVIVGGGRAAP